VYATGAPLSIDDTEKPVQLSRQKQRRQQIIAVLDRLANEFPQTFSIYGAYRKPLKIGIFDDIVATGVIPPHELRWPLCAYCNSISYLKNLKVGATRVDLAGDEAGVITEAESEHARAKLDALLVRRRPKPAPQPQAAQKAQPQAKKEARKQKPAATEPVRQPRGDGFAALKSAAARRRETGG
jgi:ProP effector